MKRLQLLLVLFIGIFHYTFSQNNEIRFSNAGKTYKKVKNNWYQLDAKGNKEYRVDNNVITVRFKKNVNIQTKDSIISRTNLQFLRKNTLGFIDFAVSFPDSVIKILKKLKNSNLFSSVELNVYGELNYTPNDPLYNDQWYLDTINAPEAWDEETGDSNIVIAILDGGIEWIHVDLGKGNDSYENIWTNEGEDQWTDSTDPSTGNGIDDEIKGSIIDDAIIYAVENGADIINFSGHVGQTTAIDSAIDKAYNKHGTFIVCASGNNGTNEIGYPARHKDVMAVGGTSKYDKKWISSNYGTNLDISAPCTHIKSTVGDDFYNWFNGTSFATPQVSGVAGLLLSIDPYLSLSNIYNLITLTADKVGGYNYTDGRCDELGYGRINTNCAVYHATQVLYLSGSLIENNYEGLIININNATVQNDKNITFTGGDITINGTFEAKEGAVFDVNNNNNYSCQ